MVTSTENIRVGLKFLQGANTRAYFTEERAKKKKIYCLDSIIFCKNVASDNEIMAEATKLFAWYFIPACNKPKRF